MNPAILVIGAFDYAYIHDHWLEPLKQLLPESVIALDVNVLLSFMARDEVENYLLDLIEVQSIRHMFFYHDVLFADISDRFFAQLKAQNVQVVTFYADDEPPYWYERNIRFDHHYACIATHSLQGLAKRQISSIGDHCFYMPWGFNPRVVGILDTPVDDLPKPEHDIVFIGRNKDALGCGLHREDGEIRDKQLQLIAQQAQIHGWRFAIFGFGWESHPSLATYHAGQLDQSEFNQVLLKSKIVFNPAYAWDGTNLYPQVKLRHFEVAANGHAMQLTNYNEELASLLVEDKEIVFYQDEASLINKLIFWLSQPIKCREVARQSRERALREHTIDDRLKGLLAFNGITTKEKTKSSILVASIPFDGDLSALTTSVLHVDTPYCYLYPKGLEPRFDLAAIRRFLYSQPSLLSGQLLVSGYAFKRDPIQPRREEIYACRLYEGKLIGRILPHMNILFSEPRFVDLTEFMYSCVIQRSVLQDCLAKSNSVAELNLLLSGYPNSRHQEIILFSLHIDKWLQSREESELLSPVHKVLNDVVRANYRSHCSLVIYGARGDLAESSLAFLTRHYPGLNIIVVDNGLVGKNLLDKVIQGHADISNLEQATVLVCAAISGPAIIEQCRNLASSVRVLPLYDLFDPAWDGFYE